MSDIDNPPHQPAGKTSAQRQADLRQRRAEEGRKQTPFWLTEEEKAKVKAFLAGEAGEDTAKIAAERDALAVRLETVSRMYRDVSTESAEAHNAWRGAVEELQQVRRQLVKAEQALAEKPARTFKVPELPDRRAAIVSAMTTEGTWQGDNRERDTRQLEQQAALAKKFATEIRHARSRLAGLVEITSGDKVLEQSKSATVFGGYNRFKSPVISPSEKALLQEACVVMSRFERDVEQAGREVAKLHKQREAEDAARWKAAGAALDAALFKRLDRRGEVLLVAAAGGSEWGPWRDLVRVMEGKDTSWESADALFRKALADVKASATRRVAQAMKASGEGPERLVQEIVEKFHHPDTREKHGALADRVTAFLVAERLSSTK